MIRFEYPGPYLNMDGSPNDPYYSKQGTPYANVSEAIEAVPVAFRLGRTVLVADGQGGASVWHWVGGTEAQHLVPLTTRPITLDQYTTGVPDRPLPSLQEQIDWLFAHRQTTNASPQVTVSTASAGTVGVAQSITAEGTDTDGAVVNMEFFVNGQSIGVDYSAPFSLNWTPAAAGSYTVTARATDDQGAKSGYATAVTVTVTVVVNQVPTAYAGADTSLTLPQSTISLSGSGTDPDGTISSYAWTQQSGPNQLTITSANAATASATGWQVGVYVLRLTVTDNQGATAYDEVSVTINPAPIVPLSTPAGLALTASGETTATASWSAVTNATGYVLELATDNAFTAGFQSFDLDGNATTSKALTGLTAGTTYYVRVKSKANPATHADSSFSAAASATTKVQLAAPTGLTVAASSSTALDASWTPVANSSGYEVQYANDNAFSTGVFTVSASASPKQLTGLAASTTYYVRVRALGMGAYTTSAWSGSYAQTTQAAAPVVTTQYQFVGDGDSLEGKGYGTGNAADEGSSYPDAFSAKRWAIQLRDLLIAGQSTPAWGDFRNYGTPGITAQTNRTDFATRVLNKRDAVTYPGRQIVFIGAGVNDFSVGGRTPQQLYDDKKAMIAAAHAAGWTVVTATLTLREQAGQLSTISPNIVTYNNLVRNGQVDMGYDALIDWAADPRLQYTEDTSIYVDKLHFKPYGDSIKAAIAKPVLEALATTGYVTYVKPSVDTAYDVIWTYPSDVEIVGNKITKIAGGNVYTPGGKARSTLAIGSATDTVRGRMRIIISELSHDWIVGLTATAASTGYTNMLYSWHKVGNQVSHYGSSASPANTDSLVSVVVDDILEVVVYQDRIEWTKNGAVRHTRALVDTSDLFVDACIRDVGDFVNRVSLVGPNLIKKNELVTVPASTLTNEPVAWAAVDAAKYTVSGNNITSLVAGSTSSVGKVRGSKKFTNAPGYAERGYVEWTIPSNPGSDVIFGLQDAADASDPSNASSIKYSFIFRTAGSGTIAQWGTSVTLGTYLAASAGDKFRITVWDDVIRWTKNGSLIHSQPATETGDLFPEMAMTTANKTTSGFVVAGQNLVVR